MNALRLVLPVLLAVALQSCTCGPQCSVSKPCPGGQVCSAEGICAPPVVAGVVVSDPAARGCEVLLTEQPGTAISGADFTGGVVGTSLREAPRVALTFVAPGDAPLPAGGVQLALTAGSSSGVTVTSASCVDARGNRLPNATVSLR